MRRLLLYLSLLAPASKGIAQKLEVGIRGGYSYSTRLESPNSLVYILETPLEIKSPTFALNLSYSRNKWQYGIAVERKTARYQPDNSKWCISIYCPPGVDPLEYNTRYESLEDRPSTFVPLRFFVNRQVVLNRLTIYGGPAVSYIFTPNYQGKYVNQQRFGWSAGAQVGVSYALSKRIGVGFEVTGDRVWFRRDNETFKLYNTTASLGLTCRLK